MLIGNQGTSGGARFLVAHATAMASTAMISPVLTTDDSVKLSIATPPANEPNAMPTLTAEAGRDCSRPRLLR